VLRVFGVNTRHTDGKDDHKVPVLEETLEDVELAIQTTAIDHVD
jgi:hypothetical protein